MPPLVLLYYATAAATAALMLRYCCALPTNLDAHVAQGLLPRAKRLSMVAERRLPIPTFAPPSSVRASHGVLSSRAKLREHAIVAD